MPLNQDQRLHHGRENSVFELKHIQNSFKLIVVYFMSALAQAVIFTNN